MKFKLASPQFPSKKKGFAFISVLSLIVLLALLAVGLLSLSSISTQSDSSLEDADQARANARMSLMLALSELQETAGPDTRITAPADAFAGSTGNSKQLVGVLRLWEGLDHDGDGKPITPDYDTKLQTNNGPTDSGRFLRWLVANGNATSVNSPPDISIGSVTLLGEGSLGGDADNEDFVMVDSLEIRDNENRGIGSYSWWIQGNNTKALVHFDEDYDLNFSGWTPEDWSQRLASVSFSDSEHFELDDTELLDRVPTYRTLQNVTDDVGNDFDESFYHVLTPYSGLLVNVATGGWGGNDNLRMLDHSAVIHREKGEDEWEAQHWRQPAST